MGFVRPVLSPDVCILFRAFFGSLYRCLARGARAVLQFYADNVKQTEMLVSFAMNAGFAGGVVVDWPHR
jgi:18S rRNA (guanine1575-N7)-methyltransferase